MLPYIVVLFLFSILRRSAPARDSDTSLLTWADVRYAIEHSLFIQLCSKGLKCLIHYNVMNPLFKNLLRQSTSLLEAFGAKLQSHWTCPSRTPYRLGEMFQSGWEASPQSHKHFYSYTTTTCARACMDVSSFLLHFLSFKLNVCK